MYHNKNRISSYGLFFLSGLFCKADINLARLAKTKAGQTGKKPKPSFSPDRCKFRYSPNVPYKYINITQIQGQSVH